MRLEQVMTFLRNKRIRATYGAVGGAVGVVARSVGRRLGPRTKHNSWVVRKDSGLPSGYHASEMHEELKRLDEVIEDAGELVRRIREWESRERHG